MAAGSLWPDTGSGWPKSDTSRLALYLARIFMRGRSFSHHCSRGILCLWSRRSTRPVRPAPTGAGQGPVPTGLASLPPWLPWDAQPPRSRSAAAPCGEDASTTPVAQDASRHAHGTKASTCEASFTYSKSVSFFSSTTGRNTRFLLEMPSTQMDSSVTNLFPVKDVT